MVTLANMEERLAQISNPQVNLRSMTIVLVSAILIIACITLAEDWDTHQMDSKIYKVQME